MDQPRGLTIVEKEFVRELDAARSVVWWNYWDFEHLTVVHSYTDAQIVYEQGHVVVALVTVRLPGLPFIKSHALDVGVQHDENTFYDFSLNFGVPLISIVDVRENGPDRCVVRIKYRIILRGWRRLLAPLVSRLMTRWNEKAWREDLPLRLRRQKVLRMGFRDFSGLPDAIADRVNGDPLAFVQGVRRLPGADVDSLRRYLGLPDPV